jgi:NIPSNAP
LPPPCDRCGGKFVGYYLPSKMVGPTNRALGFIGVPNLAVHERYREKLMSDTDAVESLRRAATTGCILNEDRLFAQRVSA